MQHNNGVQQLLSMLALCGHCQQYAAKLAAGACACLLGGGRRGRGLVEVGLRGQIWAAVGQGRGARGQAAARLRGHAATKTGGRRGRILLLLLLHHHKLD